MNIERASATLAREQAQPYTTFLNATLSVIETTDALAIYTYLQTKAQGWIVRRTDVMNRFSITKERYAKAVKHLKDVGLMETVIIRDDAGKATDNRVLIHYTPKADVCKSRHPEKQEVGKSRHLVINQLPSNESTNTNSATALPEVNQVDKLEIAFDLFWEAGMKKLNKKKALTAFKAQFKSHKKELNPVNPEEHFASHLITDIKLRLKNQQFGFATMHPTTYLNGERWTDEQTNPNEVNKPAHVEKTTKQIHVAAIPNKITEEDKSKYSSMSKNLLEMLK
tara:strand:- start:134 stop:976 length:843 start_codon:yes stop_codon:yes gene_type:complete